MRRAVATCAVFAGAWLWCATLTSCDRTASLPAPSGGPLGPPDQTYSTRGVVTTLPADRRMLSIHHESIPTFKNKFGETQAMKSHDMPFPNIGPGVSIEGVVPGDKVELTFEVRWKHEKTWILTRLAKIPADTALNLGNVSGGG